jgi:hypothetical protein
MPSVAQRTPKSKYSKVSKGFSVKIIYKQKELVYAAGRRDRTAPVAAKLTGSTTAKGGRQR